jgi:hypothetical protein
MIVDEDDRRRIMLERPPEYRAGVDREFGECSVLKLLVRYEAPRGIKEQYSKPLVGQRSHRGD